MFSQDTVTQGGFLVSLFTFIFTVFQDESKFQKRLEALAVSHAKRGIKSIEYGIIGEVSLSVRSLQCLFQLFWFAPSYLYMLLYCLIEGTVLGSPNGAG